MDCRVCKSKLKTVFSLGAMPLVNSFLRKEGLEDEKKYDLSVAFCQSCFLVQLTNTISPEELFSHYLYFSSTSASFLKHCKDTAENLIKRFRLGPSNLVMEIGSNDGALLDFFKKAGIRILGIDPAKNIAETSNQKGITTIAEFFNSDLAKRITNQNNLHADLVYGANVLAHVPEIVDFTSGVKTILAPQGSAVFEFPYLRGLIEGKFDTIYHEHVFYYSLIALKNLFQKAGLELYDVELVPTQGGSLRIFVSHPGIFPVTKNVTRFIDSELKDGFDKVDTYYNIEENAVSLKKELIGFLDKIKSEGKNIAAYGAPAKGNVLLNYFCLGENYIDFIVDKSEAKQGLYTPGTHLFVYPVEKIAEEKLNYLLILCWNLADEVMQMEELKSFKKSGGKFIIPVPRIKVR